MVLKSCSVQPRVVIAGAPMRTPDGSVRCVHGAHGACSTATTTVKYTKSSKPRIHSAIGYC